MDSGIDSIMGGNLNVGLSTIILPPFGNGNKESLGPNTIAIDAECDKNQWFNKVSKDIIYTHPIQIIKTKSITK